MRKKDKIYLVCMCGSSGSGKSYITERLVCDFSDEFHKPAQYTTRQRRNNEDPYEYYFVNKEHYKIIEDKLICKTEINGEFYGTIPAFVKNKINILIVNSAGYKDFKKYAKKNENIEILLVRIESERPKPRIDRDENFVINERKDLDELVKEASDSNEKTLNFVNTAKEYITTEAVRSAILKNFNL